MSKGTEKETGVFTPAYIIYIGVDIPSRIIFILNKYFVCKFGVRLILSNVKIVRWEGVHAKNAIFGLLYLQ